MKKLFLNLGSFLDYAENNFEQAVTLTVDDNTELKDVAKQLSEACGYVWNEAKLYNYDDKFVPTLMNKLVEKNPSWVWGFVEYDFVFDTAYNQFFFKGVGWQTLEDMEK